MHFRLIADGTEYGSDWYTNYCATTSAHYIVLEIGHSYTTNEEGDIIITVGDTTSTSNVGDYITVITADGYTVLLPSRMNDHSDYFKSFSSEEWRESTTKTLFVPFNAIDLITVAMLSLFSGSYVTDRSYEDQMR